LEKPLHNLEKRMIKALAKARESTIEDLSSQANMNLDQVRRAAEWLRSKGLVSVQAYVKKQIYLNREGRKAIELGLPERRLITILSNKKEMTLDGLRASLSSSSNEFSAALGYAKKMGWIQVTSSMEGLIVKLLKVPSPSAEEEILKRLVKRSTSYDELSDVEKVAVTSLAKRPNYITFKTVKTVSVRLTNNGTNVLKTLREAKEIDALTSDMVLTGRWRRFKLRPLDVEAPSPPIYPGKKHPVQRLIDEVREIFVSLGFEEIEGPLIQPCFWNFDALFTPQDHPAREMQDTFYIKGIKAAQIADEDAIRRVSKTHENGGMTASKGWGYRWRLEKAKSLVLRTHTTAVTVRYLADFKPSEAKVFSIGRVFRNEKVTFKNLVEFHQIEGIAVGEHLTLRDMMGLLNSFYARLGLERVKFWPSYFPYTEPSLQSVVYYEKFGKWVELCGMGIFRPEVTLPLGVKNPVLAWGGGLERLVMLRYNVYDARQLYENNLGWLRRVPLCR
jgi:phenylalanyl-tRNA synthetase alpha chain